MRLRVAGCQMAVTNDIARNAAAICQAIDAAAKREADLLLTPEGSLSGYTAVFDETALEAALLQVSSHAAQQGIALALGTCRREPDDGALYNQLRLYNRSGRCVGFHTKQLLCGVSPDNSNEEYNQFQRRPLQVFRLDGLTVGALICNDLWANPACTIEPDPHLTRQLARQGARIILHAVNGGRDASDLWQWHWNYHEANLQLRALADRIWIITVDSAAPVTLPCSAPSGVVGPDGRWICRAAAQGDQLFICDIHQTPPP